MSPQSLMMEAETIYKILEINYIPSQHHTKENFTALIRHEGIEYLYLMSFQEL
jgi:hypothetical protein